MFSVSVFPETALLLMSQLSTCDVISTLTVLHSCASVAVCDIYIYIYIYICVVVAAIWAHLDPSSSQDRACMCECWEHGENVRSHTQVCIDFGGLLLELSQHLLDSVLCTRVSAILPAT